MTALILLAIPAAFLFGMGLCAAFHRIETSPPMLPHWHVSRRLENIAIGVFAAVVLFVLMTRGGK